MSFKIGGKMLISNCYDLFSNINNRKTKKFSPGNEKMLTKQRKVVISKSHTIIILNVVTVASCRINPYNYSGGYQNDE
jgi:hypothetical protein